jgi:hypothetical protein
VDVDRVAWCWLSARDVTLLKLSRALSGGNLKLAGLLGCSLPITSTISSSSDVSLPCPSRSKSALRLRKASPDGKRGECMDCELEAKSLCAPLLGRS